MNLQSLISYILIALVTTIGIYINWARSDSDYELNTATAPPFLTSLTNKIATFSIPAPPLPKSLTRILTKKDRSLVTGHTHGFKYIYRAADLNRLTPAQRELVRDAVANYFDTHAGTEIDKLIAEGDALVGALGSGSGPEGVSASWTAGTGTACLKLDDRWGVKERWGPLEGYMKIGRAEVFDEEVYCGPTFTMTVLRPQFEIVDGREKAMEKEEE
ncbi:hypothetical protein BJY04DRAFT_182912 [Aspergillus karnatakaensis]|uniref:uncharacterized protein n=1 Tax=Aspergillus karnatakaensis TaxID=1810916 RepID=UPI003CCCFF0A